MSFLWPDCLHNTVGVAAILLLLLHTAAVFADDGREQALQAQLRTLLAKPATADTAPAQATAIQNFYAAREHRPAWVNSRRLMQLRQLGQLARNHGLDPADYHLTELAQRIEQLFDTDGVEALAALELMATYSIARLASHLHVGKVDPVGRYAVAPGAAAAPPLITRLLTSAADAESLFAYLDSLPPDTLLYRKLQWSLAWHRALLEQGTAWALIPRGRTLETGMTDARVPLLRQRLGLAAREIDADVYDAELTQAVADFQARHLLDSDGLLGRRTLAALNTSIQARVDQLRVNLEWQRWAAMPEHDEYLLVNVAHYTMHWMQDGARVWSTRTMVGRSRRPTPTFKSAFSAIMINPAWTVPPTIFREDLLPQLQADAGHLQRQRMRVIDRSGHAVDSAMIDWQQTSAADFPYRLRASPGGSNPLGRMKFLTPNPYLVYLHDTPAKHLFENATRAFSSGCIRVEQPEILAKLLTDRQPGNVRERLQAALAGQRSRFIGLEQPIPIVVMYGTVDLNAADELVFARDLYGKDLRVLTALNSIDEQQRTTVLANLAPLITL